MFKSELVVTHLIGTGAFRLKESLVYDGELAGEAGRQLLGVCPQASERAYRHDASDGANSANFGESIKKSSEKFKSPKESGVKISIVVPAGFVFDGASVPKIFTNIMPKSGARYDRAACLHDWCYAVKILSRKQADNLFLEAMKADGVNLVTRNVIYCAVRAFGWVAWSKVKQDESVKLINTLSYA